LLSLNPPPKSHQQAGENVMPRIIEVIISPTGESTVQTNGFTGGECLQASQFLESALGLVSVERKTSEFYNTAVSEQHIQS
jgi:Protein of unknown function (DUF2997)